ncbi:MAG: hypothetical protein MRZ79_03905 [Bacteroidia bacterium]|nr:hypothetical protein [Bacteroidia bacterium]
MKRKTATSLAYFGTILGFVLLLLALTGVLYSLPFWKGGNGALAIFVGAACLYLGPTILGLTALRSSSGVVWPVGMGLLLLPFSVVALFLFNGRIGATFVMATFHGLAFLIIGGVFTAWAWKKKEIYFAKWTLSVFVPAILIAAAAFFINVAYPEMLAKNYVEDLTEIEMPASHENIHFEEQPVFGLGSWIQFEAKPVDINLWLNNGPECWRESLNFNGKTEFFNPEMRTLYNFWKGRELPHKYMVFKCNQHDPQSYILVDQSEDEMWKVYINVWED